MKQLIHPERFVCSEFNVHDCYSLPRESELPMLYICQQNVVNRSRDFFLRIKHFSETRYFKDVDADDMPKACDGAYKTYNERDLEQLKRLFKAAKDNRVIEDLNPEIFCSLFIGYSIFSIS